MEPKKYDYIDGLRGLAILLVLMLHCGQAGSEASFFPSFVNRIIENGQYGVQLFFLVSAYTLSLSFHSRTDEPFATRNFFIRRFFRIAPLYYLAISYYLVQNFIGFDYISSGSVHEAVSYQEVLANVFFINDLSPIWINHLVPGGWSVTVEFTFYFFLPLICARVRNINHSIVFFLVVLILSSILRLNHTLGATALNSHNFLYWYFPNQLPVFALGMLAFYVSKGIDTISSSSWLLIAATIFIYCFLPLPEHIVYSLLFFALLIGLSHTSLKLFVNKITIFIGRMSFSLYLVHFAVLYWLHTFKATEFLAVTGFSSAVLNYCIRYLLLLSLSCVVCHFTYKHIELPSINLGRRLIKKLTAADEMSGSSLAAQPVTAPPAKEQQDLSQSL